MTSSLGDTLNLLRSFTLRRVSNLIVLRTSFIWSRIIGRPRHSGLPVFVSIEPTTHCNLSCPGCTTGSGQLTRPSGNIETETLTAIIEKIPLETAYITLYFQGEPFLNKHFFELIKLAKSKNRYVAISTNGHFLDEDNCRKLITSGPDRLIVSLDGPDKEVYEQYRIGGDFDKVCEGIRTLSRIRKESKSVKPFIVLQSIVFRQNENRIREIKNLGKNLGADKVELKSLQVCDFSKCGQLIPFTPKYSRYFLNSQGKWILRGKAANHCRRMWEGCVITWDTKVIPCCFDKNASIIFGNLSEHSLVQIWKGSEYNKFREMVFAERSDIPICGNCTESLK